ncbi:MAG: O-methyltransferase [Bacteroidales bacterium]
MDRKTEEYIIGVSSREDPLLEELYRQTYLRFVNPNMTSGHIQGRFLEMISKMIEPENILEIGTFTGYSAICLARGLKAGGKLVTIEINDELESFSAGYFKRAGLCDSIIQLTGKAQDLLPKLETVFDLAFIDGDKREYCEYYRLVRKIVKRGGFIIADNVLWGGKAMEVDSRDQQTKGIIEFNKMISDENDIEKIILPVRDGIMLMRVL